MVKYDEHPVKTGSQPRDLASKEIKLEERTLGRHDSLMAALSGGRLLLIILS